MPITKGQQQCPECNQKFTKKSYQQIYCQISCQIKSANRRNNAWRGNAKSCARCGTSLAHKKSHAIYCSKTCKSMDHTFKHRSKTRVASVARRKEIFERDQGKCYICNTDLDLQKFELDHLLPVSRNGSNDASNLATSCTSCNRKRGDRIGVRQLEKLFELRPKN